MTLFMLLLTLAVVAGVAAVAAGLVSGGLDDPTSTVPARELPPGPVRRADVAALRFVPALRGYRMDQVDAAMDRLGDEIEHLHAELAERDRRLAGPTSRVGDFDAAPPAREPEPGTPPVDAPATSTSVNSANSAGSAHPVNSAGSAHSADRPGTPG